MSDACETSNIKDSFVEDENKINIEETSVNLDCVKNEPKEDRFNFEQDGHAEQYRITLGYENIFGESSHQIKIEEDSDNLIGFLDNDVIMENAMIKLEGIKEEDDGSFKNFHCSNCKGVYNGYCLKCSFLLHILNKNSAFVKCESESNAIPADILEIRETSQEKGVYLLRTVPMNIIFGPFEGVLGIEHIAGHSWKIVNNKLTNIESGNWMKNIVYAASDSLKNLEIFQFEGNLYFQTNREISEGEELLIYYDDDKLRQLGNSEEFLYTPKKQEKLLKIFACTMCCLGFGSSKCLMEHKRKCFRMEDCRNVKDIVLVECHYCKMWMEKWEHEEHHVAYCLEKYHRMRSAYAKAVDRNDTDLEEMKDDFDTMDDKRTYQYDIYSRPYDRRDNLQSDAKDYQCLSGAIYRGHLHALAECSNNEQTQNAIETKHLNKNSGIKPFTCDICMAKFINKSTLKRHTKAKHRANASAKDHKCLECSYQTNYKGNLQIHLTKHRGIKPFKCDICMMSFTQKGSLKAHIKAKHSANAKDYKCIECSYQTNYKINLQTHLNMHRGIKPFRCDICMMSFTQKGGLKKHINYKHTKNFDLFKCDICTAKFTQKYHLNKHIQYKHTDDGSAKDYQCSECTFQTNYRGDLHKHLNRHRGIKPFTCDICMNKFGEKRQLNAHIRDKHRDDESGKKYKCLECPFESNYKSSLRIHLNKHRGIAFTCDICQMKFTQKGSLKTHIKRKHTNDGSAKD